MKYLRVAAMLTLAWAMLAQEAETVSLQEVVRLWQTGMSEELLAARIKKNNRAFDLNSAELAELKTSGVSDAIVRLLMDPASPYTPPVKPVPAAAAAPAATAPSAGIAAAPSPAKPPADPLVLKLPPEQGLYWFNKSKPEALELKPVVTAKAGGKSKLLLGLKKGHVIGSLAGVASRSVLPVSGTDVYAKVMTPVEDIVLVQLEAEDGRRELDFGTNAAKPAFPPKSVHPFESKDVGQGVIRISLPLLDRGEYLLFILGSGEEKKGTLGKGWEFSAQ